MSITAWLAVCVLARPASAQKFVANYDESKIPAYTLPELLVAEDGTEIADAEAWETKRRPEVLAMFEEHVYGKTPAKVAPNVSFETLDLGESSTVEGAPLRKLVRMKLENGPTIEMLVFLPKDAKGPVPAFLGLNFQGNHSITNDPDIPITGSWQRPKPGVEDNKATEKSRGVSASRWPVGMITSRGYALATVYYGDIDPDFDDGFQNGIHPLFYEEGQTAPKPGEWGAIGAWTWGLRRAMDFFEKNADFGVDASKVAVLGHSRLGKTSLWAGAQDPRFAIVISNNSGCGGAALHRRAIGETVGRINTVFPHWFCDNFNQYNENEGECPVDQHMLIALIAPRPAYVASAQEDKWADPKGEFLSARHAEPVYALYGMKGIGDSDMPEVDCPVGDRVGYHMRSGGHDVKDYDWGQYLNFADRHFLKKTD